MASVCSIKPSDPTIVYDDISPGTSGGEQLVKSQKLELFEVFRNFYAFFSMHNSGCPLCIEINFALFERWVSVFQTECNIDRLVLK